MIVCNGIVGACLLGGGARHHEQGFQVQGASAALAVLVALTSLTMVLPNYAATELGPLYSKPQLIFAGLVSLALDCSFVFIQTVRHRDYFLPVQGDHGGARASPGQNYCPKRRSPSRLACSHRWTRQGPDSYGGLVIAYLDVPKAVVGIIIAALVLLPESVRLSGRPEAIDCKPA